VTAAITYELRAFPARIAGLGFSIQLPQGWVSHELPAEDQDFSNPAVFAPLAVVTAPHAAIVFAFAARPRFDDGTLHDWAHYLLAQGGLECKAIGEHQIGTLPALVGEATLPSELGPMVVRFAFFEDGGRLVNVTLTAPELLADAVTGAWVTAMDSFALTEPRGPTVALFPPVQVPEPELEAVQADAVAAPDTDAPFDGWAGHALSDDAATLDPEHQTNVRLRDKGAGLVPRVISLDDDEKRARIGAGALVALIDVPYGWHVIDDGRRTLMLDPSGAVQIHLHRIQLESRSVDELLDAFEAEARESYPDPQFLRLSEGGIQALAVRGIHDGDQPLEQFHLITAAPGDARTVLRARVTAVPERAVQACNLGERVLASAGAIAAETRAAAAAARDDGRPAWWHRACELEAAGELTQAEETILTAVQHIGGPASVAQMYALRMERLQQAGDVAGARHAFERATHFMDWYASLATSGGEGTALSRERDVFVASLTRSFERHSRPQTR
jgi:hypothetical protein